MQRSPGSPPYASPYASPSFHSPQQHHYSQHEGGTPAHMGNGAYHQNSPHTPRLTPFGPEDEYGSPGRSSLSTGPQGKSRSDKREQFTMLARRANNNPRLPRGVFSDKAQTTMEELFHRRPTLTALDNLPTLEMMKRGNVFTGYAENIFGEFVRKHLLVFYAPPPAGRCGSLYWADPVKGKNRSSTCCIPLLDITDVILGKHSDVFEDDQAYQAEADCCFTVVTATRTIDLEAKNVETLNAWLFGINSVLIADGSVLTQGDGEQTPVTRCIRRASPSKSKKNNQGRRSQSHKQRSAKRSPSPIIGHTTPYKSPQPRPIIARTTPHSHASPIIGHTTPQKHSNHNQGHSTPIVGYTSPHGHSDPHIRINQPHSPQQTYASPVQVGFSEGEDERQVYASPVPSANIDFRDSGALLHVHVIEGKHLKTADLNGYSDPYFRIELGKHKQKSKVQKKTLNPLFDELFTFPVEADDVLSLELYDKDTWNADDFLGRCSLSVAELKAHGGCLSMWAPLRNLDNTKDEQGLLFFTAVLSKNFNIKNKTKFGRWRASLFHESLARPVRHLDKGRLHIQVGSWNVGNAAPPSVEELMQWFTAGADIYVVGTQECQYEVKGKSCRNDWNDRLQSVFNKFGVYTMQRPIFLLQIRLVVFIKTELCPRVGCFETSTEATGIAGVYGNKGGVALSFSVDNTSFCFVNCHLAAHQDKTDIRNANVEEIIQGLSMGKERVDILHQFNHLFWFGDLNYRVEYQGHIDQKEPSPDVFEEMVEMVDSHRFQELFQGDQLAREMAKGAVFQNFSEGPCNFRPTFKVQRGYERGYMEQRSPAWCDRVLWKTRGASLQQLGFTSVDKITTSDHKPVWAQFDAGLVRFPSGVDPTLGTATITITDLKATGLRAADPTGLSDPFLIFVSDGLIESVQTKVIKKTLNPVWGQAPPLKLRYNTRARVGAMDLLVVALDWDLGKYPSKLGFCRIDLQVFAEASSLHFNEVVEFGGLSHGRLEGTMTISWEDASFPGLSGAEWHKYR